jgi:hypothetical protein
MSRLLPVGVAVGCALAVVACDQGSPAPANVRLGNLVPDAPAVDFCLKPQTDSAFSTPFVGGAGLGFAALSGRADIDAGTYAVRLVPAPATNCNSVLGGLGDFNNVQFTEGGAYTLAAIGRLSGPSGPSVALNPYADDLAAPTSGVKLRYVHAAPEVSAVDIGALSNNSFFPQVTNLAYPGTSNPTYVLYQQPGLVGAVFAAAAPPGSGNVILQGGSQGVTIPNTSVSTLWLVGRPNQVGDARLSFLLCPDNASGGCQRFP